MPRPTLRALASRAGVPLVTPSPCISTIAVDETKYWDALRRLTALEYLLEHARPEEEPPDMNVCLGLALLLRDVRAQLHPVED